jgi:tetratricopeptide (TPR) repeat protein
MVGTFFMTNKVFVIFVLSVSLFGCSGKIVKKGEHVISNPFAHEVETAAKKKGVVVRRSVGLNSIEITLPEQEENTLVRYPLAELRDEPVTRATLAESAASDRKDSTIVPVSKETYLRRSYLMGIAKTKQHYQKKEYELALVDLESLLEAFPNDLKLLSLRGTIASKLGFHDIAEDSWLRALRLNPDNAAIRNSLGQIQRHKQAKK